MQPALLRDGREIFAHAQDPNKLDGHRVTLSRLNPLTTKNCAGSLLNIYCCVSFMGFFVKFRLLTSSGLFYNDVYPIFNGIFQQIMFIKNIFQWNIYLSDKFDIHSKGLVILLYFIYIYNWWTYTCKWQIWWSNIHFCRRILVLQYFVCYMIDL